MIVVDTNIIAYLLIEGIRTEDCRKVLLADPEWCVPFLWRSEFRNVLSTHMRHAAMSLEGAVARMQQAESLLFDREYSVASPSILEVSKRLSISACDAEFASLAMKLDTKLITTDKALLNKMPKLALDPENFSST